MNNQFDTITRKLHFNQPIERVWQAITEPQQLRQWFGSDAQFDLAIGATGYFEWLNECEGKYALQIIDIQAPHYFSWRWMQEKDVEFSQSGSTLVEWKLTETATGTQLTLIESGFASAKHHQMNTEGWQEELADLVLYLS